MAIKGALFDLDGTILDSMEMWNQVMFDFIEEAGSDDTAQLVADIEHLNLREGIEVIQKQTNMSENTDENYARLHQMVAQRYKKRVKPMPGIQGLLDELKAAEIPMGVVSTTPANLVTDALEAHALSDYFAFVLSTEDVGKDKTSPDIYEQGLERLGVPKQSCWVFEDAPFAARTATLAGFPVLALLNDHDGRDPEFMKEWSDILVRDTYEAVSLSIINDFKIKGSHS